MRGRQILLARHGSTGSPYLNRYLGSTDAPLAGEGLSECRQLGERIGAGFKPVHCWCSPLLRARQTAAIVAEALGIAVSYEEGLREIDFGRWEGLSFSEITAQDPELVAEWTACPDHFRFPGGEGIVHFRDRVREVAERLAGEEGPLLVIAHGGVVRAMICQYLDISMDNYLLFDVKPARFAVVTLFDGKGVLQGLNL